MAAEKKHDDPHKDQPPRPSDGPPAPRHTEHQQPVKDQSQKAEIAQYYKSQGKRPEDVVFTIGGMNLTLADLE